ILLRNVDIKWMDHLEDMDNLMDSIGLQAYAQRNPINEYRIHGADLFDDMINQIRDDTVRGVLSVMPRESVTKRVEVAKPVTSGFSGGAAPRKAQGPVMPKPGAQNTQGVATPGRTFVNNSPKVGRNDPCPCGSGKKYKKCCGSGISDDAE
ncbi:MAG: preprotein translocase subunit SecA, partial [Ruminococcaceae bacterium]|nr:preprotein translocase subunit SecA [Oscillospiraceae bacterium]